MPDSPTLDDAAFTIRIDPARKLLDIDLRGLWDPAIVVRFRDALATMLARLPALGCPLGQQVTLFDMTQFAVQPREVLPLLEQIAANPGVSSRRIAIVVNSTLLKMQAKRLAPNIALFEAREPALAWLAEDGPAAR
ncbi:hypothetical protein ASE73_13730 [Sphingomonas sp. Leaf24]|uniref:hypothetical protein n=1 Tax=unclassified Sphingomonas TaxID=196159 RepID=UPI0006F6C28B|nr:MULTISPECIES: hypothetical protein [unclassified Sphingomonas]KQM22570.1 hypothetical protein ASE50_11910 [Sphingomonas sp. Leaf5]KQM94265.1 hypothetical protein ASE73_13730 [Sphingomonas sp. Leaf24]